MPVKAYLESHGCTMNYGEGRLARARMESAGYSFVTDPGEADVLVLNTCGVIELTENTMYRRIRELDALGKRLLVTGCLAGVKDSEIRAASAGVQIFRPNDFSQLDSFLGLELRQGMDCWNDVSRNDLIVPIAQGCLSLCSYCFSRVSRGNVRSIEPENIVSMIRRHVSGPGSREVMLSGMDTIAYGRDIGTTLPDLLNGISAIEGDFRVRVGMMNPSLLPPLLDRLMDAFADRRIYKFFHIPFQSGSDSILRAMKRGYTNAQFISMVERIRERYPEMTLSTDIIVGFPGESEEDFAQSLGTISEVRPDVVNVTRFSARPGTPAFSMKNKVPGWAMKERSRRATRLRFAISAAQNSAYVGKRVGVLMTEKGKNGFTIGRLDNYRQAIVRGNHAIGSTAECDVSGSTAIHLVCEPLPHALPAPGGA